VSIEVANESGVGVDEPALVSVARYVLDRMGINPMAELSVLLMVVPAMTELHVKWMDEPGPTDVMSFPMDELDTARRPDESGPGPALLGDVVLCPEVAAEQAVSAGHSLDDELHLLTVHGVLHLLGYDHAEPATEREMFRLQNELLDSWRDEHTRSAQQDRIRAVDSRVLDTVGLADGDAHPEGRTPPDAAGPDADPAPRERAE
jgi:probable rRNA maturation factor